MEHKIYPLHFAKHTQQTWLVKISNMDEANQNNIISCLFDKLFADEQIRKMFIQ
ncbi:hypothetical protein [Bacillus sp. ISL-55]|uniref:hypothetical protein n=1 Tax=Bacillus sp. ISL-55 TaxID=2819134 RepID=UPI001BEB2FED|nr:hypothetical protein [Bacillus sp. ISL-55]